MTAGSQVAPRLAGWVAIAAVAVVAGTPSGSRAVLVDAQALAPAIGVLAGIALFAALARGMPQLGALHRSRAPAIAARSAFLGGRAAVEELVWRAYVFGGLTVAIGAGAAFVLSTVGFALSHMAVHGRRWPIHLVTGGTFGGVYYATGSLGAAIAAHAAYNVLVGLAIEAAKDRPGGGAAVPPAAAVDGTLNADARRADAAVLEAVEKRFGETWALRGIDLRVQAGECVALLGANGAGKTTALAILLGLRRPDRGRATLFGRDPRDAAARRRLGVTPQETAFPWTLRVREIVQLVRAHFPDPADSDELLARFQLTDIARRQAGALSGGQRRRLAAALAFAGNPSLIVLDEPSTGLDVESRRAVWDEVRRHAARGGTVVFTTHYFEEAEALASRVVLVDRGTLVVEGTVETFKRMVGLTRIRLRARAIPPLESVSRVERQADEHTLYVEDADAAVAELVRSGAPFSDLEIRPLTLEEAVVALTGRG